jgi:pyruvate,orthophosphate dikinase
MRFVHAFDSEVTAREILGGKGAGLVKMVALGLPIPPGFTIGTAGWALQRGTDGDVPSDIAAEINVSLTDLERRLDRRLGDRDRPLLLSVRSGAPVSMPGMMDTILNLGLNDEITVGLAAVTSDRFAWELYIRLLQTYAEVVRDISSADLTAAHAAADGASDDQARADVWKRVLAEHGPPFPQDPRLQLDEAVRAVWRSWEGARAQRYRRHRNISEDLGTAVTVQAMVFGNLDDRSGTGVVFTRDPATGVPAPYGDFLLRAQGEDVVAGTRTPEPIDSAAEAVPEAFADLQDLLSVLETAYGDMCDIEFTVESGKLWILQARVGQRSGPAAVRIAVDMVDAGLIDVDTALDRIPMSALEELQAPVAANGQSLPVACSGVPASPGTVVGHAVFDVHGAEDMAEDGIDVVLFRPETDPRDIAGMIASVGIVTAVGGRASHAAVVARGIGRPAVCGVTGLKVDEAAGTATLPDGTVLAEGDVVTVDGSAGTVARGAARLVAPQPDQRVARLLSWCDDRAKVPVAEAAPDGFARVTSVAEAKAAGDCVLVDLPWEGAESTAALNELCRLLGASPRRLAFAVPIALRGGDIRPPAGRWELIVSAPRSNWAARLLSARIVLTRLEVPQ